MIHKSMLMSRYNLKSLRNCKQKSYIFNINFVILQILLEKTGLDKVSIKLQYNSNHTFTQLVNGLDLGFDLNLFTNQINRIF